MQLSKLAEAVLIQLESFYILQELDQKWREQEPNAVGVLTDLYTHRPVEFGDIFPVFRILTALSALFLPIAFTLQSSRDELQIIDQGITSGRYEIDFTGGRPESLDILRIFRNSVAHMPDFMSGSESPNISFDEGILCCRSRKSKLVFLTESGYICFLTDLTKVVKATASKVLDGAQASQN